MIYQPRRKSLSVKTKHILFDSCLQYYAQYERLYILIYNVSLDLITLHLKSFHSASCTCSFDILRSVTMFPDNSASNVERHYLSTTGWPKPLTDNSQGDVSIFTWHWKDWKTATSHLENDWLLWYKKTSLFTINVGRLLTQFLVK